MSLESKFYDFESGMIDAQTLQAYGGVVSLGSVVAGEPAKGSYSAKMQTYPSQNNGQGRARIAPYPNGVIGNWSEGYMQGDFYVKSWDGYIEILEFSGHLADGTYKFIGYVIIAQNYVRLLYRFPTQTEVTYSTTIETDKWYNFAFAFKIATDGYFRVYKDGIRIINVELDNTVNTDGVHAPAGTPCPMADRAWSGIVLCAGAGDYYEMYEDNFGVQQGPMTIMFTTTAQAGGTVTPLGTAVYPLDSNVTITAIPDAGYKFNYWYLDGVLLPDPRLVLNWHMGSNVNNGVLEARFALDTTPPPVQTIAARSYGGLGLPIVVIDKVLRPLRNRVISAEVHKKLHPLV